MCVHIDFMFIVIRSPWLVESFNFSPSLSLTLSSLFLPILMVISSKFFVFFLILFFFYYFLFSSLPKIYFCVCFYAFILCFMPSFLLWFPSSILLLHLDTMNSAVSVSVCVCFFGFQFGGHKRNNHIRIYVGKEWEIWYIKYAMLCFKSHGINEDFNPSFFLLINHSTVERMKETKKVGRNSRRKVVEEIIRPQIHLKTKQSNKNINYNCFIFFMKVASPYFSFQRTP